MSNNLTRNLILIVFNVGFAVNLLTSFIFAEDKPVSLLSPAEAKSLEDLDASIKTAGDESQNKGILYQNAQIAYQQAVHALTLKQLQRSEAIRNLEREKCQQRETLQKQEHGWACVGPKQEEKK